MARFTLRDRSTRESLAAGRRLAESVRTLTVIRRRLRKRATQQCDQVRGHLAFQRMGTTPLEALRRVTTKNLRLAELEGAGLSTVSEVLHTGQEELQEIRGIGPQSAAVLRQAADDLLARTERELPVRIDPDARTQDSEDLLRTLRMLLEFGKASRQVTDQAEGLATVLPETLRKAEPAGSWWRMLLARRRTRETAATALRDLRTWVESPATPLIHKAATGAVTAARKAERMPASRLWRDYQRNGAAYTTLLAEVDQARLDDTQASHGFVPADIAEEAGEVALDTSLLRVQLRTYQVFGAKFALARQRCVLGDEMGLGKTVQAIAVMAHAAARGARHFLVVCPASVVVNWIGEVGCHSALKTHHVHGSRRDTATARWIARGGVAVTTFETLQRLPLPEGFRPDYVIVDEAHYIKNPGAKRTVAVNTVADRAPGVLMMTGTPLENKVEEFRDLVSYLDPGVAETITVDDGLLGPREFRRRVAEVYLRRNQEDVLKELPESLELEDWVALTSADERAYQQAVVAGNFAAMRRATVINREPVRSAKLERLVEIVDESTACGWKVVIFSFFLNVLSEVEETLRQASPGVSTFRLSGKVPVVERQQIVNDFSKIDGHAVLISQITAGGVGLNIQAASVVILTEPQLKPTIEEQAIARCRRMGQTRKVRVHRLLAKDTVDERILEILGRKSALIEAYARESDAKEADPAAVDGSLASGA
ncbi:MAG: DEAD/DEAH box helicase, partial [Micromonosporaceae bacterium]|nr:DEAD/DEAH box helicase [Micromonosporaceae bacterium]